MDATDDLSDRLEELSQEFFVMETPPGGFGQSVGTDYVLSHPDEFFE